MSDREYLKLMQQGYIGSLPASQVADAKLEVRKAHRRTYTWTKIVADTNAGDNTAEFTVAELERPSKLIAVRWCTNANVAAHNTNSITLTVSSHLAADPPNAITVANGVTTVAGLNGFTAWTPKALTIITTNSVDTMAAGTVLTLGITKASSGVAMAAGMLMIDVEEV